jgi:hypothetical protein
VGKPALCSINARTNIDRLTRRSVGIGVGAVSNELIHAAAGSSPRATILSASSGNGCCNVKPMN